MTFYPANGGGSGSGGDDFKGFLDATGSPDQLANARVGDYWAVSVAGTILGEALQTGEFVTCVVEVSGTPTDFTPFRSNFIEITDNLTGTTATKALSENQGRILLGMIESIPTPGTTVTQNLHGFSVDDVVSITTADNVYMESDKAVANSHVVGCVFSVIDANTFTYRDTGILAGYTGLTAGDKMYLDSLGKLTNLPVYDESSTSQLLGYAINSTQVYFTATPITVFTQSIMSILLAMNQGVATTDNVIFKDLTLNDDLILPNAAINKAVVIASNGHVSTVATSDVELGYVAGATSNLQAQINAIPASGSENYLAQTQYAERTAVFSTSSGSWFEWPDMFVNITETPGRTNRSKFLISMSSGISNSAANSFQYVRLVRTIGAVTTVISQGDAAGLAQRCWIDASIGDLSTSSVSMKTLSGVAVDAPASTALITYHLEVIKTLGGTAVFGRTSDTTDGNRAAIPSYLTVTEILQ